MTWIFAVLVVLVMGGIAAVAVGRGAPLAEEHVDRPDTLVPATGPVTAADLRAVRFPLVVRGYRMADVDALLDRLAEQLDEQRVAEASFRPAGEPRVDDIAGEQVDRAEVDQAEVDQAWADEAPGDPGRA